MMSTLYSVSLVEFWVNLRGFEGKHGFCKKLKKPHFQCFAFPNQEIFSEKFKKTLADAEFDGLSIAKKIFNFGADLHGEKPFLVKIAQKIRKTAIFCSKGNQNPSYSTPKERAWKTTQDALLKNQNALTFRDKNSKIKLAKFWLVSVFTIFRRKNEMLPLLWLLSWIKHKILHKMICHLH